MAFNDFYLRQVRLLVRVLPFVAAEPCFALKGGTAINLFIRDVPRLSVDIDLTYLPVEPRDTSLAAITAALKRIAAGIKTGVPGAQVTMSPREAEATKLVVRSEGSQIKIEVTPVLRGSVFEPKIRAVSETVESTFGFAEIAVVSFADLYAGKIVAALDRQHPRDLFDIRDLLRTEGITDDLRQAFLIYLVSHDRPMSEVLEPNRKDLTEEYAKGFEGMTEEAVSLLELAEAREALIATIVRHKAARDTMLGLMKTCAKLKLSFYRFLGDRFAVQDAPFVEKLPTLVRLAAA